MQNKDDDFREDYDGSVFVNCRSFIEPTALLERLCSGQPVSLAELARVLEFIQTCALSQNFYYDGSVPGDTREAMEGVSKTLEDAVTVEALELGYNELFKSSVEAVSNAQLQLKRVAEDWSGYVVRALDESDAIPLMEKIRQRKAAETEKDQEALSHSVLQSRIRGRKMLAGVIHPSNSELFTEVYERIAGRNLDDQAEILSGLINVFRGHLLSTWATDQYSAHQLLELPVMPLVEYNRLSWGEVSKHVSLESRLKQELQERGAEGIVPLAPIGLWALAETSKSASPGEVIEEAVGLLKERAGTSFRKTMWDAIFDPEKLGELEVLKEEAENKYVREGDLPSGLKTHSITLLTATVSSIVLLGAGLAASLPEVGAYLGLSSYVLGVWLSLRRSTGKRGYINFRVKMSQEIERVNLNEFKDRVNLEL